MREVRTVLVTGAAGFIGTNLVRGLLAQEPELQIVSVDVMARAAQRANARALPMNSRHILVQADVCDRATMESLLRDHHVNAVIHLAAETHVDRSIADPESFVQANVLGSLRLLEAFRAVYAERPEALKVFCQASTDEVYGTLALSEPAFTEESAYRPRSPYAASKAAADHLARAYHETYGLPIVLTNCSNNYGPYQFPEKFIPLMIHHALTEKSLPVYGDGRQRRDWLYVDDHCAALWQVAREGRNGETYLIGGAAELENIELLRQLCAALDEARPRANGGRYWGLVKHVADRPGHDRRYAVDSGKLRSELGWEPRVSIEEGLRKTVAWYLEAGDWLAETAQDPAHVEWMRANYEDRGEA